MESFRPESDKMTKYKMKLQNKELALSTLNETADTAIKWRKYGG
jgi:hypothetical protein